MTPKELDTTMSQSLDEAMAHLPRPESKPVLTVPSEIYALLESIAELPPPSWHEVKNLLQDPTTAFAAVVHASPLITAELARIALAVRGESRNLSLCFSLAW